MKAVFRVPLIISWKGKVAAGTENNTPVTSVDYHPTILGAVGLKPNDREIDGQSLIPTITGMGSLEREAIYWHFPHYRGRDVTPLLNRASGRSQVVEMA